ncbi:MAG: AMP-binding protein, partial [Paracoccus sp. (in: a-proteobacteria)]|nr:AMP-binding protein [Paracoccus sp. (in: a-proteobacteria)]
MAYRDIYAAWQADPEAFWMEASKRIDWHRPPSRAFFDQGPVGEWFADASANTCWNAVDRHVAAGHGDRIAIIHDSPLTGCVTRISYADLQDRVARLAGVLKAGGVAMGDRVIIYMPMVPEAVEAMLACARIGAIHSVVFGGFAAHELAVRINDAKPRAVIAASCGLEPGRVVHYKPLLDRAIDEAAHKPDFCVILQRPQEAAAMIEGRDLDWQTACAAAEPADCLAVAGNHPA